MSRDLVRLYHPREDERKDHFQSNGPLLVGKTPIGRTTVEVLALNHPHNVQLREALLTSGESLD